MKLKKRIKVRTLDQVKVRLSSELQPVPTPNGTFYTVSAQGKKIDQSFAEWDICSALDDGEMDEYRKYICNKQIDGFTGSASSFAEDNAVSDYDDSSDYGNEDSDGIEAHGQSMDEVPF